MQTKNVTEEEEKSVKQMQRQENVQRRRHSINKLQQCLPNISQLIWITHIITTNTITATTQIMDCKTLTLQMHLLIVEVSLLHLSQVVVHREQQHLIMGSIMDIHYSINNICINIIQIIIQETIIIIATMD